MVALAAALLIAAPQNVLAAGGGNALTLPAQRHLVRLDPQNGAPATWLLAVQQDGASGHWLSMYRSTDEAQTWRWYAPVQDVCCERDTPDLLAVGMDVALVYSWEGPTLSGSTAHDVYFQWWRWNGNADWGSQTAVKVFDSTSSATAYLRAELARDSLGRLWVWAQRLNADGTFTMVMAVSSDGGATFQAQPSLDTFADRPGGRILPVAGNQLMLIYGTHGVEAGYMRLRTDTDPVSTWGARQAVFPEGIYHGAALSAAGDGGGGVYLLYKDVNGQLWYRRWSGSWSGRTQVESAADWALQPAITRVGGSLVIFWNRVLSTNTNYQFFYRVLANGSFGSPVLLDGSGGFQGYPASADTLPNTVPRIPCFYGKTPDASSSGNVALAFAPTPNAAPPAPDAGTPDAGTPDAGAPDAGTPDAGPPPAQSGILFSDDFKRTTGLGPNWRVVSGSWHTSATTPRAESDLDGSDQAVVQSLSCADCSVSAQVINFSAGVAGRDLRQQSSNDRYDVALLANGNLQIRRHNGATVTVLGEAPSGIPDLGWWATIALSATGSNPVNLVASVDGVTKLVVNDSSPSAIRVAGTAGIWTNLAGIWFGKFTVTGAPGGGAGGGTPDAGSPDAGTPDAGPPDAGPPDAGPPDAGPPDAGSPDAGSGVLFSDGFNRATGLGSNWRVVSGSWHTSATTPRAESDLDGSDQAVVQNLSCADCSVSAQVINFAAGVAELDLRQQSSNNRYDVALLANGTLQVRRHNGATVTVLGQAPSGIADLGWWATIGLSVTGSNPVKLVGSANGIAKVIVNDSSASAVTAAGTAGMWTDLAGIWFRDFTVSGSRAAGGTDGGTPDAGPPDAGPPDAGSPDAGPPDAGPADAGPADGGGTLSATVTYTETGFDLMAVDRSGTAYGVNLNAPESQVWTTVDGRSWTRRGGTANGASFWMMTPLSDNTLIADVVTSSGHALARSTDHGVTWTQVLNTGVYRTLTPHSFAELDGAVFFIEYQVFTTASTPIRLWKSLDRGVSWSVQFTFQGHRHGHGLMADPPRHALFAFFGDFDDQSGLFRSTDGGASWTMIIGDKQAGDIVDGVVLSDGSFLCGQDISFHGSIPDTPQIARVALDGTETDYQQLPTASYSTHAISAGGYVVGATYETSNDISPPGWTRGSLWGSGDAIRWQKLLDVPQLDPNDDVRTDVYWELATGELVVSVRNASGFGPGGRGYMLLHTTRQ